MMMINPDILRSTEMELRKVHAERFAVLKGQLEQEGVDVEGLLGELMALEIEVPSWALGTGGTRFGRFPIGGEPGNLFQKIEDVALLKKLTASVSSISLHIPWDIPKDSRAILELLEENELRIDSVNSNTFQDYGDPSVSYKFGSLCHTDAAVRRKAIDHNIEVIRYGEALNARILTVWLSDGSDFPGQHHFRRAYSRTLDSLSLIYEQLPADWNMLVEYKPYEPHFYSMVIPDWGTSLALCQALGNNAKVLVDLGHHLPNTNIEQIVARLMLFGRLGGFHFNGSMYGDDDLTTGSIKPYQLFLIFQELNDGMKDRSISPVVPAWMIDASHNIKDPLEDLMQSCQNIRTAYAKALLVDRAKLQVAQEANDAVMAEEVMQRAFQYDVRPLVREAMIRKGGSVDPIAAYRNLEIRKKLISSRGEGSVATGL
jgi:L-rhamnose isomerase/sugar isomerase